MESAALVNEPQRSRIISKLDSTVFISHTSRDNEIVGLQPNDGLIYSLVCGYFEDPFKHSITSGAATEYEKVVGLALTSARWVLVIWTRSAIKSDYVRAEVLLATEMRKTLAVYCPDPTVRFPISNAKIANSRQDLQNILINWRQSE